MADKLNLRDLYSGRSYVRALRFTMPGGRVTFDATFQAGLNTFASPEAKFTEDDVGTFLFSADGIPLGTTILSVTADGIGGTMSNVATETVQGDVQGTLIVRAANMSAWSFDSQIRERPTSTSVLATFDVDDTNSAGGELLLKLDSSQLNGWLSGVWDLTPTNINTSEILPPWLEGTVKVTVPTTRV